MTEATDLKETLITLTADIVAAHVSNNSVAVSDLPNLISNVHGALSALGGASAPAETKQEPAVSVRSSIKPDYIVCLEDGKKLKMLKRHLMTHYGLTPDDYRAALLARQTAQQTHALLASLADAAITLACPGPAPLWSGDVPGQPLAPRPPNGVAGWAVGAITSFTTAAPTFKRRATSSPRRRLLLKTAEARPNGELFTAQIIPSSFEYGKTPRIGAKVASLAMAMHGLALRIAVGAKVPSSAGFLLRRTDAASPASLRA